MSASLRDKAVVCFQQGVASADPYLAVKRYLLDDHQRFALLLNDGKKRKGTWSKIYVIAFGKAACAMAKAAKDCIPLDLLADFLVITNDENWVALEGIEVVATGHPLPDERGLHAARRCAERVTAAKANELVLLLISGGGSALLPLPVAGVTLADKMVVTQFLLASGANINEMNCVRKHLSQLKGGCLAALANPADVHALILSDVLGDDLSSIASGPTVPDGTTYNDAITILKKHALWDRIPDSVRQYLQDGQQGRQPETPKANHPAFLATTNVLIGSNKVSVNAMMTAAEQSGFHTLLYSDCLYGEARQVAENLVLYAKQQLDYITKPLAIIAGGETTVTLKGNGLGGRNQEMALAFALYAKQHGLPGDWVFLSGGTDGRDGPTDAAGGLVDHGTIQRLENTGIINPVAFLDNNDSYHALDMAQDLLKIGATGTNVADLQLLLIEP